MKTSNLKKLRKTARLTQEQVAEKLNEVLYQKQVGTYVPPQSILLGDWMLQWIHNYAAISVRPSTYISYEGYVHNHINPILGQIPLQHITPVIIQNFYNQKYESGRTDGRGGLSAKTIRNLHNMLHQALEQAKNNGLILHNPTCRDPEAGEERNACTDA